MDASDLISIVALAMSVAASGLAIWIGYVTSRSNMVKATYTDANAMLLEVNRLIVDFPEFRPYLYDGKRIAAADPQRDKLIAAAVMVLDVAEYIWQRREDITEKVDRDAWEAWLVSLFHTSPSIAELYREHPQWYPNLALLLSDQTG